MFIVTMDDATSIKWSRNDPFPGCLVGNIGSIVELLADESELTLIKDIFWSYSKPMVSKFTMNHPVCSVPMPYGSVAVWYGDIARTICANLYNLDKPNEAEEGHTGPSTGPPSPAKTGSCSTGRSVEKRHQTLGRMVWTCAAEIATLSRSGQVNKQNSVSFRTTTNRDIIDVCTTNQCSLMRHHGNNTRIGRIVKALPFREKHTCWLLVPGKGVNYDTLELQQISKKLDELNNIAWSGKDD